MFQIKIINKIEYIRYPFPTNMEEVEYDITLMDEMIQPLISDMNKNDKQHIEQLRDIIIVILNV